MSGVMPQVKKIAPSLTALLFILVAGILIAVNGIPQAKEDSVPILFSLDAPEAESVAVVGDFNHWDPKANLLHKQNGIWRIEILLKKGNTYLYNFLIDDKKWITDPNRIAVINDGFGGKSVLEL